MTGKELFEIWAPNDSIWSRWVSPALFAQIDYAHAGNPAQADVPELPWHEQKASPDTAVVIDLPGAHSIRLALALAWCGYRPVPIINASPGPTGLQLGLLSEPAPSRPSAVVVLDMSSLVREICEGTPRMRALTITPDAPPAFVLDSLRLKGTNPLREDMFDNRWMVFPQDFPSAKFLAEQKIKHVTVVQAEKTRPQEDLSHVLLRWQEAGIEILTKASGDTSLPSRITVSRPSRFKASWYRALAIMGLRRSSVGGFGSFIPETSAAG
ncbi:MAG TPA: hypothetical protein VJN93_01280 [Candidatus Acidoferrum sp.]|nr:hypothetical protein [Candidatus Acidoferrum sp.]